MNRIILAFLLTAFTLPSGTALAAVGDPPVLVKDINAEPATFSAGKFHELNGSLFTVRGHGLFQSCELARVDPLETVPVAAFETCYSTVTGAGNIMIFAADDGASGYALWASDGTATGTRMLTQISPRDSESWICPATGISRNTATLGGTLYFLMEVCHPDQVAQNRFVLWKTDGSAAGTSAVFPLNPGNISPDLILSGNRIYVIERSYSVSWPERIWVSDGTTAGTQLVAEFPGNSIATESLPQVDYRVTPDGAGGLFFWANDPTAGTVLWHTDGTAAGTSIMTTAVTMPTWHTSTTQVAFQGKLFFCGTSGTTIEFWVSDGTAAGTVPVTTSGGTALRSLSAPAGDSMAVWNNGVYFLGSDGTSQGLWKSDGTPAGTVLLSAAFTSAIRILPATNRMHFVTGNGVSTDVWTTDGTAAGTTLVTTLPDNPADFTISLWASPLSIFRPFTAVSGDTVYASVDSLAVWRFDGTAAGTYPLVSYATAHRAPHDLHVAGGTLFWIYEDAITSTWSPWVVWSSDGTVAGTGPLPNELPATDDSFPSGLAGDGAGPTLFIANDGTGKQLWTTDGTAAGTAPVTPVDAAAQIIGQAGGMALIYEKFRLLASDGTAAGTVPLVEGLPSAIRTTNVTSLNGNVYFAVTTATGDTQLWVSDGSAAGTQAVDTLPGNADGLTAPDSRLWLTTYFPGPKTYRLTVHTGLAGGGTVVLDAAPAMPSAWPQALADGRVLIGNSDQAPSGLFGESNQELWISDGTTAGTVLLKEINPGAVGSNPTPLGAVSGGVLFSAYEATNGPELWITDGTAAGTQMVADIRPGPLGGLYSFHTPFFGIVGAAQRGNLVYFSANDGVNGEELWVSDGTAAGTRMVADTNPGPGGFYPSPTVVGDRLYMSGTLYDVGNELFAMDLPPLPQSDGQGYGCSATRVPGTWGEAAGTLLALLLFPTLITLRRTRRANPG